MTQISNSVHARQQAKKFKKNNNQKGVYSNSTGEDLKRVKKHYKRATRARRRQCDQIMVNDTDDPNKMLRLNKMLNKKARNEVGLQTDENGNLQEPKQSVDILAKKN